MHTSEVLLWLCARQASSLWSQKQQHGARVQNPTSPQASCPQQASRGYRWWSLCAYAYVLMQCRPLGFGQQLTYVMHVFLL